MTWKKERLGNILNYEQPTNYIVGSENYSEKYKIPVLTAGKSFILGYTDETHGVYKNLPAIIFDDFTTDIKYVDFEFKVKSSAMKILTCESQKADIKFLFYLLKTINFEAEQHKRYWISTFANFIVPLPPLSTQKRIVEILDAADSLRRKDQELLGKYDELAQSIFIEMFGDPVKNEKGWSKVKMETLMKIVRGGSPRPIDKFLGGTYPWIKIGDATKGDDVYLNSTKEFIIAEGVSKTRLLPSGSLIFANCGVSLGFARIITFEGCIHDGWLAFSDFNEEKINKFFLLKALNTITDFFRKSAPEGTQPNLNTGIIKDFELILPPIDLQDKFENILISFKVIKENAEKNFEYSDLLFNSFIQKIFKSELIE